MVAPACRGCGCSLLKPSGGCMEVVVGEVVMRPDEGTDRELSLIFRHFPRLPTHKTLAWRARYPQNPRHLCRQLMVSYDIHLVLDPVIRRRLSPHRVGTLNSPPRGRRNPTLWAMRLCMLPH